MTDQITIEKELSSILDTSISYDGNEIKLKEEIKIKKFNKFIPIFIFR